MKKLDKQIIGAIAIGACAGILMNPVTARAEDSQNPDALTDDENISQTTTEESAQTIPVSEAGQEAISSTEEASKAVADAAASVEEASSDPEDYAEAKEALEEAASDVAEAASELAEGVPIAEKAEAERNTQSDNDSAAIEGAEDSRQPYGEGKEMAEEAEKICDDIDAEKDSLQDAEKAVSDASKLIEEGEEKVKSGDELLEQAQEAYDKAAEALADLEKDASAADEQISAAREELEKAEQALLEAQATLAEEEAAAQKIVDDLTEEYNKLIEEAQNQENPEDPSGTGEEIEDPGYNPGGEPVEGDDVVIIRHRISLHYELQIIIVKGRYVYYRIVPIGYVEPGTEGGNEGEVSDVPEQPSSDDLQQAINEHIEKIAEAQAALEKARKAREDFEKALEKVAAAREAAQQLEGTAVSEEDVKRAKLEHSIALAALEAAQEEKIAAEEALERARAALRDAADKIDRIKKRGKGDMSPAPGAADAGVQDDSESIVFETVDPEPAVLGATREEEPAVMARRLSDEILGLEAEKGKDLSKSAKENQSVVAAALGIDSSDNSDYADDQSEDTSRSGKHSREKTARIPDEATALSGRAGADKGRMTITLGLMFAGVTGIFAEEIFVKLRTSPKRKKK